MLHFFDLTPDSLAAYCTERDMPRFVAAQLLDWVYRKGVTDPQAMTNIAKRHRDVLCQSMRFYSGQVISHQIATDHTQKLLIQWAAGNSSAHDNAAQPDAATSLPLATLDPNRQTECVLIPAPPQPPHTRRTACISSQIGCPVGCKFCASGLGGLDGNLRAGQIVEQVHRLAGLGSSEFQVPSSELRSAAPEDKTRNSVLGTRYSELGTRQSPSRVTNIVFMGMGEPLANFANVTNAIRTLNAPWGMNISARKITVSTVGLPAAIRKLVNFEIPVTLALSLHAPNDELRRTLIPWASYATIDELLDACDEYFAKTGREITLEYLLLRNVNDRLEHARELANLAKRLRANVNLIRYNEVRGLPFDRPTTEDVLAFQNLLRERRVNAHLRASRGRDIAAACGQLRHEHREQRTAAR